MVVGATGQGLDKSWPPFLSHMVAFGNFEFRLRFRPCFKQDFDESAFLAGLISLVGSFGGMLRDWIAGREVLSWDISFVDCRLRLFRLVFKLLFAKNGHNYRFFLPVCILLTELSRTSLGIVVLCLDRLFIFKLRFL